MSIEVVRDGKYIVIECGDVPILEMNLELAKIVARDLMEAIAKWEVQANERSLIKDSAIINGANTARQEQK